MEEQESDFELTEPGFLTLLVKHEPTLRAYARSLVPDWDLVDEALQDMLLVEGADPSQTNNDGRTPLEIVTLDFDEDLQGSYLHVYDWLNLELDLDDIKSTRIQIAGMFRNGQNLTIDGDAAGRDVQDK